MAKLEIFNSKATVKESETPRTSALALPFSLATQRGSAISDVAKSIASIQKDMYAIEDTNTVNRIYPQLKLDIDKKYNKYKNSRETDAPNQLIKDLEPSNFKGFLDGKSGPVQRLLKGKIAEQAALLVPKLNGQVSTNNIDDFTIGLNDSFDDAIAMMISKDQAEMASGTIAFENLINNQSIGTYIGVKEYASLVKTKTNLRNKLLLNANLQINPKEILQNQEALFKAVGPEASQEYVKEAKNKLTSNRVEKDRSERLVELREQSSQIGAFTDVVLRIDNFQKNQEDESIKNELPTIDELYQLYEDGLMTEPMLIKATAFLTEDAQDGMTDSELFMAITTQIYSAKTVQQLDDIKKSYILDNNILKSMAMEDIGAFNAIIDKAKGDFESHKDYQFYSKLINSNIRNISTVRGKKGQAIAAAIANKEQFILQSYNSKVMDGMSPENAYLSILEEEFNEDHIPSLSHLPFPNKNVDFTKALADTSYFELVSKEALDVFAKSNKSSFNAKRLIDQLDKINFAKDIFGIRMRVAPGKTPEERFVWATKNGQSTSNFKYDPDEK